MLKDYLNEHFPHLEGTGASEQARQAFLDAINQSWRAIEKKAINACINSMRKRVRAVIAAKGWYTRY